MGRGVSVSADDSGLLTIGNSRDTLPLMRKAKFGDLLHEARRKKGFSLRDLAKRTGINYSRLSRIEHGTRPAPGLAEIRQLADSLDVEMSDLLVSSGTPREVMEHLLWSERLRGDLSVAERGAYVPERSILLAKNAYRVPVRQRVGALCTVVLGEADVHVFSFSDADILTIHVPPEAVYVHRRRPDSSTAENVLLMRVRKIRRLGQVANLVLAGDGFELNTLHADRAVDRLALSEGDAVFASVQATAIRTEASQQEAR